MLPKKMTNSEISINKTSSIKQQAVCGSLVSETHNEDSNLNNENVSHIKRNTPILFSTNRGLHLRMTTATATAAPQTASLRPASTNESMTNSAYSIIFCDLERWSTNRANTISLEDTFIVPKPPAASGTLLSNSLRFVPRKSTSLHFNGYSRFDVE